MSEPTHDRSPLIKQLDQLDDILENHVAAPPPFPPGEDEEDDPPASPAPLLPTELLGELESLASVLSPAEPLPRRPHDRHPPGDDSLDLFPAPSAADEPPAG